MVRFSDASTALLILISSISSRCRPAASLSWLHLYRTSVSALRTLCW
jgi:hypothetical protein